MIFIRGSCKYHQLWFERRSQISGLIRFTVVLESLALPTPPAFPTISTLCWVLRLTYPYFNCTRSGPDSPSRFDSSSCGQTLLQPSHTCRSVSMAFRVFGMALYCSNTMPRTPSPAHCAIPQRAKHDHRKLQLLKHSIYIIHCTCAELIPTWH